MEMRTWEILRPTSRVLQASSCLVKSEGRPGSHFPHTWSTNQPVNSPQQKKNKNSENVDKSRWPQIPPTIIIDGVRHFAARNNIKCRWDTILTQSNTKNSAWRQRDAGERSTRSNRTQFGRNLHKCRGTRKGSLFVQRLLAAMHLQALR